MIRRNLRGIMPAACALGMAVYALGCGGKADEGNLFESRSATTLGQFDDASVVPLYFNETKHLSLGAKPMLAGMNLVAAAQVQLEVATTDSSPLRFELYRVRKDHTTELLAPVDSRSGWDLETFEASSDDLFVLWFPQVDATPRQVNVMMTCLGGAGRCAPTGQPGESCAPGFACDEGLDCILPPGDCDPWVSTGVCGHPQTNTDAAACGSTLR
jgi:hypothetical protein